MKDFNSLSGPWTGLSIQAGMRLTEAITLTIRSGSVSGNGTDVDGEFELLGSYHERTKRVLLTRRYVTAREGDEGIGIPYDYDGTWDGQMVSGYWQQRSEHDNSGPFEMWPSREEDQAELAIGFAKVSEPVGSSA